MKILRKKIAKEIEDEFFTIKTTVDNLHTDIENVNYKNLKRLDLDRLKRIRVLIQSIDSKLKALDRGVNKISELHHHPSNHLEVEIDGQKILVSKVPLH